MILSLYAMAITSCCPCEKPMFFNYTNKIIRTENIDNAGLNPIVSTSDSIVKTAFGVRINIKREKIAALTAKKNCRTVYATSCECPPVIQFLPKDSIKSVKIFALNYFDKSHLVGSDISEYFKLFEKLKFSFENIETFPQKLNSTLYDESEFQSNNDLLLMTPPEKTGKFIFKIQFILSDNKLIEFNTKEIRLI
jgi:Domain of unknown function (DUF5034)